MREVLNGITEAAGQTPGASETLFTLSPDARLALVNLVYLVSAALFIFGLRKMSHPRTALRGNLMSSLGMLLAIAVTLLDRHIVSYTVLAAGVIVGSIVGATMALRVKMTAMPQMVGFLNGSGGLASAIVAFAEYMKLPADPRLDTVITIILSTIIGMVTFAGSMVAFGKLEGLKVRGVALSSPITFKMQHWLNLLLGLIVVGLGVMVALHPAGGTALAMTIAILLIAAVLGVLLVIPIGGADMPVVICLLNSYSGLAAMTTGFVLDNKCLIIAGSLVGASGMILTKIMCVAMNRSLINVVAGGFGTGDLAPGAVPTPGGDVVIRRMDAEEAVMVLESAGSVIIVPGYGMAVAQAQHAVAELAAVLGKRNVNVQFGIHPVAGRMPGHMNILLAEANVPYEQLHDLEINSEFDHCDVALVIGANDVVNPAARHNKSSPIYGMPILDVDKARTVMVCKRSLNPGFAGIENELFTKENTVMLFGDAKAVVGDLVKELSVQGGSH